MVTVSLPSVHVRLAADGSCAVTINGTELPAVIGVQILGKAGEVPRLMVELRPGEITVDLPETGVQIIQSGPTATDFARSLSPARLEQDALQRIEEGTQGEAFAAAVLAQAGLFDDRG